LRHNPSYLNFPGEGDKVEYKEGLFVGYRYYDAKGIEPLFPFGYGLSYTSFEYSNLSINKEEILDNGIVEVSVTVNNTGDVVGKEIVQLYVRDVESTVIRPAKELKGFEKVQLQPGDEKIVTFFLDKRSFAYYNMDIADWHVESGVFEILVGKSSADIQLKGRIQVNSTVSIKKSVHRNTTIGDLMADPVLSPLAQKTLAKTIEGGPFATKTEDSDEFEMLQAMMKFMPLRALVAFNPDNFNDDMLNTLLKQLNDTLDNVKEEITSN